MQFLCWCDKHSKLKESYFMHESICVKWIKSKITPTFPPLLSRSLLSFVKFSTKSIKSFHAQNLLSVSDDLSETIHLSPIQNLSSPLYIKNKHNNLLVLFASTIFFLSPRENQYTNRFYNEERNFDVSVTRI